MDELPRIDTSVNTKPIKRAYKTAQEKELIKVAISVAVAVFVVVLLGVLNYRAANQKAALDAEVKGLHDSAWKGVSPEDVERWSKP